jgi:hypothetical protein
MPPDKCKIIVKKGLLKIESYFIIPNCFCTSVETLFYRRVSSEEIGVAD